MEICKHYKLFGSIVLLAGTLFFGTGEVHASGSSLNDPLSEQWAYADVGAYAAWNATQGSRNVVVALIDNGFDSLHPDLRQNVWKNVDEIPNNLIDDDENGYIDDVWGWSFIPEDTNNNGSIGGLETLGTNNPRPGVIGLTENIKQGLTLHHGTAVAGIIGAVGGNGKGMSGISPRVQLMNIRLVDETGVGTFDLLGKAVRYAVDNGADIINISMVGNPDETITDDIAYAYEQGVVVVAAAGNSSIDLNVSPRHPVCADDSSATQHILGVGSVSEEHRSSYFSNSGSQCIDIAAPGEHITSTVRFSPNNGLSEKYKSGWSGTSFSAPLVSGTAALIKAIQPTWGPDEIYKAILLTTQHTPGQDEKVYADLFGAGLLQVDKAVQYALDRITSHRIATSILFISPSDGATQEMVSTGDHTNANEDQLEGVDAVVSHTAKGAFRYVTSRRDTRHERSITTYSDAWEKISSISVPASGPLDIVIGDVTGNGELDLVVSPMYADDQLFRVYSLDGTALDQYSVDYVHNGVSLALTQDGQVVTYSQNAEGVQEVNIFNSSFSVPTKTFVVSALHVQGDVTVGDIDGDLEDEIIVGGAIGEGPLVSIYEQNGSLKRTFSVYSGYTSGFSLHSIDYNQDGKDDILTVPKEDTQAARVWSGKSKKLATWELFAGMSLHDMIALVRY